MPNEKIIVKIKANGEIQVETLGMKGESCLDIIDIMENLLQAETIDSSYTAEYYEQENVINSIVKNQVRRK